MAWALVFSGQGLQHPEMLRWLARDASLAWLEGQLGIGWRERLGSPAEAGQNRLAQMLLTATACAAWHQLQPLLPPPAIVAGYSVGELPAFAAAGVIEPPVALALSVERAACMEAASPDTDTGLIGVTQASPAGLAALCEAFDLEIAIRFDPGSAVLGGRRVALLQAAQLAAERGWRCTPLNIQLASHTRWMRPAVEGFGRVLEGLAFRAPSRPLVSNALGRVRTAEEARVALSRQIAHTVRWDACMEEIAAQGVRAVLEIGPGQALARRWQDRYPEVPARSADEFRKAGAIANWLERHGG